MFFRTSPVWSAREEEIKSNKAYFGMISSAGLVLKEKKKHTHTLTHPQRERDHYMKTEKNEEKKP